MTEWIAFAKSLGKEILRALAVFTLCLGVLEISIRLFGVSWLVLSLALLFTAALVYCVGQFLRATVPAFEEEDDD